MSPFLLDGAFVLTTKRYFSVKKDDVVIAEHPRYGRIIKRVLDVSNDGLIALGGDNPNSKSNADLGSVPRSLVFGKVVFKLNPPRSKDRK